MTRYVAGLMIAAYACGLASAVLIMRVYENAAMFISIAMLVIGTASLTFGLGMAISAAKIARAAYEEVKKLKGVETS